MASVTVRASALQCGLKRISALKLPLEPVMTAFGFMQ